jgi:branched-chain amino acid transport system substrate-binding protein
MVTPPPDSFGALLRRHRVLAGLTQEKLAARAGLSTRAISDLERGVNRSPQPSTLLLLAEALHLSAEERAHFEMVARWPSASGTQRSTGAPSRAPITPPETPTAGAPAPLTAAPSPATPPLLSPAPETLSSAEPAEARLPSTMRTRSTPRPPPEMGPNHAAGPPPLRRQTRGKLAAVVASALLVGVLLASSPLSAGVLGQQRTLCLATDLPTTGDDSGRGKPVENAVNLAVRQNQALGNGYTLQVINYNDVSTTTGIHDAEQGAKNVADMVRNRCIVGMVGPYNSNVARAELPITASAGLVMISPSNTNPALTLRGYAEIEGVDFDQLHPAGKPINYFRITPNDVTQGVVDADLAFDHLEARSVYVVSDRSPYGEELAAGFTERFQVKGGRIVGIDSTLPGNPSVSANVAARIVATVPDVVFYGGVADGGGAVLKRQLVQLGYNGAFVGGDALAGDPAFVAQAGQAANGTFASAPVRDLSTFTSGAAATFIRDYHARYPGQGLSPYCPDAYDAAMMLIQAIKYLITAGKEVTRAAVLDQIQNIQYTGVTGAISFDKNGDIAHGVFSMYEAQDGKWGFVEQMSA